MRQPEEKDESDLQRVTVAKEGEGLPGCVVVAAFDLGARAFAAPERNGLWRALTPNDVNRDGTRSFSEAAP